MRFTKFPGGLDLSSTAPFKLFLRNILAKGTVNTCLIALISSTMALEPFNQISIQAKHYLSLYRAI